MLKAKITVLLFVSIASVTNAQNDTFPSDTVLRNYIGVHAVTSPIANGFELTYTLDKNLRGEELSIFFSGTNAQARQMCSEFTDTTRTSIAIADRLPFDPDISRYEITARRHNFFATRYSKLTYNKKRKLAFRRSFGYRLSRWQVETSSKPFFPNGFIFRSSCGADASFFGSDRIDRFSETELQKSSSDENPFVHTVEAGLGVSYRTSPLRRLMFTLELNTFALLPLNKARLKIESPGGRISTNYMLETKQQVALNFDLSAGLIWRLK